MARSWQDQDGWRLARLVDALNRAGASSEYSDENGSISSGCETASTSNSEERALGADEHNHNHHHASTEAEPRTGRRVIFADDVMYAATTTVSGPRRNSDGSPNFMTCAGSPRFHCARTMSRKLFRDARSVDDEAVEEGTEEEDVEETTRSVFDFEDPEDFDEVRYNYVRASREHQLVVSQII